MTDYSLELAALLRGIEVLWKRAGRVMPKALWAAPALTEIDTLRLQIANRLAGSIAPDNSAASLASIFGQIKEGTTGYLPVQTLSVANPAYPVPAAPNGAALKNAYEQLCSGLEVEASKLLSLHEQNLNLYVEGVYLLLERYASNVPISAQEPGVSLLDYNHTVAGLCSALRAQDDDKIRALHGTKNGGADNDPIGLLISGDIAGVQDFIYSLTKADQAAKQLRGRSFYLQALTEAVQRYLLGFLDLPLTSVIYSGGAKFYVLAPYSAQEVLDDLRRNVTQGLLSFHKRDLYLVIGSVSIAAADLQPGKISARWGALHSDLAIRKRQRYAELIDTEGVDYYGEVFSPTPRREHDPLQGFFEQVGRAIPYSNHVSFGVGKLTDEPQNALEALEISLTLDAPNWNQSASVEPAYTVRYAIRDGMSRPRTISTEPLVEGIRYMVNLVPMENGEPRSFDDLAQIPAFMDAKGASHGIKRLGILRMDVDNLGTIFKEAFGEHSTLARITTLSRTLATFFEGRVGEICRQVEKNYGEPAIYSVYAGGDDVFLVGPWHLMPDLASKIREEFGKLTLKHPGFTISGGIALVAEKFPLYQAAEIAHEALEKAKARQPKKNALCFLEEVMGWDQNPTDVLSFTEVDKWAKKFIEAGKKYGRDFPVGILGRLMEFEEQRRKSVKDGGSDQWGHWIWQGIYQFYRLREQYERRNPDITQLIKEVLESLQQKKFANLPTLAVAARWAHLTLRRMSGED